MLSLRKDIHFFRLNAQKNGKTLQASLLFIFQFHIDACSAEFEKVVTQLVAAGVDGIVFLRKLPYDRHSKDYAVILG